MIAKVNLKLNHHQYTKKGEDCEIVDRDSKYTYFKRAKHLRERPRQRKFTEFRVSNHLLPLYFYCENGG